MTSRHRRPTRPSLPLVVSATAVAALLVGCTAPPPTTPDPTRGGAASSAPAGTTGAATLEEAAASLRAEVVVRGLDHPWDLAPLPDGSLLVTERSGEIVRITDGVVTPVVADLADLFAQGETGLMGLALDPAFASNRRFYTCQGNAPAHDIRVIAWTLAADGSRADRVADPLVSGLVLSSGRHGGCRLAFDAAGALLVSAGDAAQGGNPQDLAALAGKVLRVDPTSGAPAAGNPFLTAAAAQTRLVYTLGHRNVQGLAVRPGTGQVFAAEHGPSVDDEVNLLRAGGNYGWNPVGGGSYDESVPMTDTTISGAVEAVWRSGSPTVATSGATFLSGSQWGALDGTLAVATLVGSHLLLLEVDDAGRVTGTARPAALDGDFGRLRTVVQGRDGAAYVLTDNGGDDQVVRVTLAG
ncbi:PQQ-dependent sugar dehydrogenase [Propionicicella superfundia]|uniref:PQQ-dependent sugar dehydrogenase n=1 Tax=Propionicicella superfundia TaxID=348582 RepID=UPI0003FDA0F6|nr:PQQ-dependent sugar dehydrogenase [Propionicicella superfundia]